MARVVVIFAILSAITGAMFWLARQPSPHGELVATIPVAASETPSATTSTPAAPPGEAHAEPSGATTAGEALPPAEAAAAPSVPPLPTAGPEANVLQQSTTTSAAAQTGLVVEDVQASGESSIALKGRADPGATVKVSVNGKPAGEVVVGGGGAWSVSVDKGKDEAEPKIVLELVAADGKVLDKTNFVFKTAVVPPLSPQDHSLITAQTAEQKPEQAHKPKRPHHATFRVRRGQSLWRIAKRQLGDGAKWREIYEANKDRIGADPDHLRPGMRLILPG